MRHDDKHLFTKVPRNLLSTRGSGLTERQQLVLFELWANPMVHTAGIYMYWPEASASHWLPLSLDDVKSTIRELHDAKRLLWDPATAVVWVFGFREMHVANPNMAKGAARHVERLPESPVVEAYREHYGIGPQGEGD